MNLPDRAFTREQRDLGDLDCVDFDTRPLKAGEHAECDTDGHYRCAECKWRNPANPIDAEFGSA